LSGFFLELGADFLSKDELVELDEFDIIVHTDFSADIFKCAKELTRVSVNGLFLDHFDIVIQADAIRELSLIIDKDIL